jgi:hypothetical protein
VAAYGGSERPAFGAPLPPLRPALPLDDLHARYPPRSARPEPPGPKERCKWWLWQLLEAEGGELPAAEVQARAAAAGFTDRTLRRAKLDLGIARGRVGFGRGGSYVWRLPRRWTRGGKVHVAQPKRRPILDTPLAVLPASVLPPNRRGEWERRARAWHRLTGGPRAGDPGYFDPVLCECALRWWTAPGHAVLDPLGGGNKGATSRADAALKPVPAEVAATA